MSNVFFIGDTHFGHKKILDFEPSRRALGDTIEEHDAELVRRWNAVVSKNDIVWHLGDVSWGSAALEICSQLKGIKKLVLGNHDHYPSEKYLRYFSKLYGVAQLKTGEVLSHIPMHPASLERWGTNIHGHLHSKTMDDPRYVCVSCERIGFAPITYEELKHRQ
jgi:calcineurin-like phosphoesterase family protein